jgi:hypothetical protein
MLVAARTGNPDIDTVREETPNKGLDRIHSLFHTWTAFCLLLPISAGNARNSSAFSGRFGGQNRLFPNHGQSISRRAHGSP